MHDQTDSPSRFDAQRYRILFENAPVPIWEEDFTEVFTFFEELSKQGVDDFRQHFENHPEDVTSCAQMVKIIDVNQEVVNLHEAKSKEDVLGNLDEILAETSFDRFKEELVALANGETEIELEGEVKTLSGNRRNVFLKLIVDKRVNGKVIVLLTTLDITPWKDAEKAVQASEEKYRLLVENQSDFVVKVDADGRFLYVSPSYCRAFGKSEEELLGKTFMPLVHPDDQESTEKAMKSLYAPPYIAQMEQRAMTRDGWRWLVWSDSAIIDESGSVVEIIGVGRDIHQQKLAEESLRKSQGKFREIIEDVSEISIQGYNIEREVVFWNQASEKLYGYSEEEALGQKLEDLIIPEPMRKTVQNLVSRWIEHGEKIPASPLVLKNKQGDDVHVYSSHVLTESPQGAEMFCIDIDLGPIREAEEAVKASELLLSQINQVFLQFTPDPLTNINLLVELAGTHLNAACALYNRYLDEKLYTIGSWNAPLDYQYEDRADGHICYDIIKQDSASTVVIHDLQNSSYAATDPNVPAYNLETYIGKSVSFAGKCRGSICVVFQQDFQPSENVKKLLGIIASAIGVEEDRYNAQIEKSEAQHVAAEREKLSLVGKIAGKMAHDFNNVLGAIMGNTELAIPESHEQHTVETLELILEQTLRGRNLTRNLVAFAKDQEPKQVYFPLNDKIDLVLNLLKKDMQHVGVVKQWCPGLPDILADPGMVEHCLVNLLQNSLHAVSLTEQPEIRIKTSQREKQICISVSDNGCGIPEQYIDHIFEPAFTLKGGQDAKGVYAQGIKGTGYGMANVKKYLEQHNGTIEIESIEGEGTTITICFPEIQKSLSPSEVKEITSQGVISGKRILVVEDEEAISDVQYRILSNPPCSHKVDVATTGEMAMGLIDQNRYDLISLDVVLPGRITGVDVYKHLRETDFTTPVLFISGNLAFLESIKEMKRDDPYVDHLSKPCQNSEYISRLGGLLQDT